MKAPDGTYHYNENAASAVEIIELAAAELRDQLALLDGIHVEHKRFAVAIHYRNAAPEAVRRVTAVVNTFGQRKNLRVTHGRRVIELRPDVAWDKGKVLEWILHLTTRPDPTMPIYIGDDLTDEDAFDAVRRDGIGIVARHGEDRDRPTAARFALDGPDAVCNFIERLAREITAERDEAGNPWIITFGGYDPHREPLREALCTTGNGYSPPAAVHRSQQRGAFIIRAPTSPGSTTASPTALPARPSATKGADACSCRSMTG